jgi:hypothetical protein
MLRDRSPPWLENYVVLWGQNLSPREMSPIFNPGHVKSRTAANSLGDHGNRKCHFRAETLRQSRKPQIEALYHPRNPYY